MPRISTVLIVAVFVSLTGCGEDPPTGEDIQQQPDSASTDAFSAKEYFDFYFTPDAWDRRPSNLALDYLYDRPYFDPDSKKRVFNFPAWQSHEYRCVVDSTANLWIGGIMQELLTAGVEFEDRLAFDVLVQSKLRVFKRYYYCPQEKLFGQVGERSRADSGCERALGRMRSLLKNLNEDIDTEGGRSALYRKLKTKFLAELARSGVDLKGVTVKGGEEPRGGTSFVEGELLE